MAPRTDSQRRVRVATVQMDFQPSAVLDYPFIEEPALLADGEQGITSLQPSIPQAERLSSLRSAIAVEHEKFTGDRLSLLLVEFEKFEIDILVFPEYCIPASSLRIIANIRPKFTVVAASHTVTRSTMAVYSELGMAVTEDDIGRSICPVWLPNGEWVRIDKLSKSRWEGALKPGSQWRVITTENRAGIEIHFGVLLCVDLINEMDVNIQRLIPRDLWSHLDLCVVPSYSPSTRDFEQRARAVAERQGRPVVYANVAVAGGSRVFCLFGAADGSNEKYGTKALAPHDEAAVIVDLPVGGYAQYSPQPTPLVAAPTSELIAVLPFLDSGRFERLIEIRRKFATREVDTSVREVMEREKGELLRLAGHPNTPLALKSKLFELLSGLDWRSGDWLLDKLDCVALPPPLAHLADKRFELLHRAQTVLAGFINDPAVKGDALDAITGALDAYRRAIDALKSVVSADVLTRFDVTSLAIRTAAPPEGGSQYTSTFAMRLRTARVNRDGLEKQIRLIATLAYEGNRNLALTLRYISLPNPGGNLKDLQIEIIGAAKSQDRDASRTMADSFRRDLAKLMRVTLRDAYAFQLIEEQPDEAGSRVSTPFPIKYATELYRKVDFGTPPYVNSSSLPKIHHLRASSSMARIVDSLQSEPSACMISIHLHPTTLTESEGIFFETCNRAMEIPRGPNDGAMFFLGTEKNPALRTSDAVTIQRMLGHHDGLSPSFVMKAFVVSDEPIPKLLLNTIGYDLWGNDSYRIASYPFDDPNFRAVVDVVQSCWGEEVGQAEGVPSGLERIPALFDPYEASRLFRLPLEGLSAAVGTLFTVMPAPAAALPEEGIEIGYGFHSGAQRPIAVRLAEGERAKHTYIVGKTGTGKSTLLRRMIEQDMERGRGVCVIDPHGDLVDSILERVPEARRSDVVLLDPSDTENPFGLNLLEFNPLNPHQRDFVVQQTIAITRKLFYFEHTGPIFEHNLRHLILTMLDESMAGKGTLVEMPRPLYDTEFRRAIVPNLRDEFAKDFWIQYDKLGSEFSSENLFWFVSKFDTFIVDRIMRNILGQSVSTINIPEVMEQEKILLVKLPSSLIGELNSSLLGMIILSKLRWAGMARASLPPEMRRPYYVYVDEFQNFAASGFESILAEARKYGLSLILAHQHVGQLSAFNISTGRSEAKTEEAIFGNVGTMISFRLGVKDAELLSKEMGAPCEASDLENLKNYHAVVKTLIDGDVYPPFTIRTSQGAPLDGGASKDAAQALRLHSMASFGRPRLEVEKSIADRIASLKAPSNQASAPARTRPSPPPEPDRKKIDQPSKEIEAAAPRQDDVTKSTPT